MAESDLGTGHIWEQRIDPWMVLWPLVLLGLVCTSMVFGIVGGALSDPTYLTGSSYEIDQLVATTLTITTAKIILAFTALLSLGIGAIIYVRMMNSGNSETEIILKRRFLVTAVVLSIIFGILSELYYIAPMIFGVGFFVVGMILSPIAGIGLVVGFGYMVEYFAFSAEAGGKGSKLEMYVIREGNPPMATEKVTDPVGGYFYMLLDGRVRHALLRMVPLGETDLQGSLRSPEDVRREYQPSI